MNKKATRKVPTTIDPNDIKTRKRHAPGVRIIKSDKDKERKHKEDLLALIEE